MANRNVSMGQRNTAIMAGEVDLTEWTIEELIRGRPRDKNGTWRGRDPKVYPAPIYHELKRRLLIDADRALAEYVLPTIHELARLALGIGESAKPGQVQAAEILLRYSIGAASAAQVIERINEEAARPLWQQAIDAGIVAMPEESGVIDTTSRTIPSDTDAGWWLDADDESPKPTPRKPRKPRRSGDG